MVEAWQHKLGVLNQMVGSVEPRPEVWNKIKSAISLSEAQAALVLPEAAPAAPEAVQPAAWRTPPTWSGCPRRPGAGAILRRSPRLLRPR